MSYRLYKKRLEFIDLCTCSLRTVIRGEFPVSEGHIIIIHKLHSEDYFDLMQEEVHAINALMAEQKDLLGLDYPTIQGNNIGMNCDEVAGQTVLHCHVHLIQRRKRYVENPRGGVRHVIAGKGFYSVDE